MTCQIFYSIEIEYSYQEKYLCTQSPAEHGQCLSLYITHIFSNFPARFDVLNLLKLVLSELSHTSLHTGVLYSLRQKRDVSHFCLCLRRHLLPGYHRQHFGSFCYFWICTVESWILESLDVLKLPVTCSNSRFSSIRGCYRWQLATSIFHATLLREKSNTFCKSFKSNQKLWENCPRHNVTRCWIFRATMLRQKSTMQLVLLNTAFGQTLHVYPWFLHLLDFFNQFLFSLEIRKSGFCCICQ